MSARDPLPLVAICGRPNVGKSTLYNRLLGKQRAIVHSEVGVTRDRHYGKAEWEGRAFRIVDTGGIVEAPEDSIVQKMQEQVREALKEADAIVFVVDGQEPLTRVDFELRDELFKYGKPVVVAANKLDNPAMESNKNEFYELGMGEPMAISSSHGLGIYDLMQAVMDRLPEKAGATPAVEEEHVTRIAVVGKPNVGKSSFINALLNEERTIVDETPGTTRDSIDIGFHWQDRDYLLIDTAGMRRKVGIKRNVERYSVARSLRAIRSADVCLVMVDASDGITEQDKRIMGYVCEQGRPFLIVWTKWDLIEDREEAYRKLRDTLDRAMPYLGYVSYMTISNVTRQRIFETLTWVDRLRAEGAKRVSTAEFNTFLETIRAKHKPSSRKGKAAKILYGTQASVRPTTFVLFVNQKRLFHFSYLRYIENQIRDRFGFEGVPIKIELREEKPRR